MKKINVYMFILLFSLLSSSCQEKESNYIRLKNNLSISGHNMAEFNKLLAYYKSNPLKLEASKFLISNMNDLFSYNIELYEIYEPFYLKCDSLFKESNLEYDYIIGKRNDLMGRKVDSLWSTYNSSIATKRTKVEKKLDLQNLSFNQLYSEIELSFMAWKNNIYTKDYPIDYYLEYLLPYRAANGLIIDNARQDFHDKYGSSYFKNTQKNIFEEVDSLLYKYRDIQYSFNYAADIPILNTKTAELVNYVQCYDRCWFNSLLFSSLGLGVSIDYVPCWGNKNRGHSWNALLLENDIYPFEPFWDYERWKYKKIYNNKDIDPFWGLFKLPKVYRYSFSNNYEGPVKNDKVNLSDIPELFRNIKKKDVSHQYFDTTNVSINVLNIPVKTEYAYLCVYRHPNWEPVQWSKIENNKVLFKGMGRGIIYLPCYYHNKSYIEANSPFLLNDDGSIHFLGANKLDKETICIGNIDGGSLHFTRNLNERTNISAVLILGSVDKSFENADTLCILPKDINIYREKITVKTQNKIKYIRLIIPTKLLAFNSLFFYEKSKSESKIENISIVQKLQKSENGEIPQYMFDKFFNTGYRTFLPHGFLDIDLGNNYHISSIVFSPYTKSSFNIEHLYELSYWENGWKSLEEQKGASTHMIFKNVPKNALLMIRDNTKENINGSRVFIYKDDEILWY